MYESSRFRKTVDVKLAIAAAFVPQTFSVGENGYWPGCVDFTVESSAVEGADNIHSVLCDLAQAFSGGIRRRSESEASLLLIERAVGRSEDGLEAARVCERTRSRRASRAHITM